MKYSDEQIKEGIQQTASILGTAEYLEAKYITIYNRIKQNRHLMAELRDAQDRHQAAIQDIVTVAEKTVMKEAVNNPKFALKVLERLKPGRWAEGSGAGITQLKRDMLNGYKNQKPQFITLDDNTEIEL
jgi:hypothetical protein